VDSSRYKVKDWSGARDLNPGPQSAFRGRHRAGWADLMRSPDGPKRHLGLKTRDIPTPRASNGLAESPSSSDASKIWTCSGSAPYRETS